MALVPFGKVFSALALCLIPPRWTLPSDQHLCSLRLSALDAVLLSTVSRVLSGVIGAQGHSQHHPCPSPGFQEPGPGPVAPRGLLFQSGKLTNE